MKPTWTDVKISIKIHRDTSFFVSANDTPEKVEDFSPWLPPPIMQYILTRELSSLQTVLQMRGYVLELEKKHISVLHVSGRKLKTFPDVMADLCNVFSGFLTRFDSRPVVVSKQFGKIDFKNLGLQNVKATWDAPKGCYWVCGAVEDVDAAYDIIQKKHPSLWYISRCATFSVDQDWTNISVKAYFTDISPPCEIVIDAASYISPPKLHFADEEFSLVKVLKSFKLDSDKAPTSGVNGIQLEPLLTGTINALVHITASLESKAILISSLIKTLRKDYPPSFGNVRCYWEKDHSTVWFTGSRDDVSTHFENFQLFLESDDKQFHEQHSTTAKEEASVKNNPTVEKEKIESQENTEEEMKTVKTPEGVIIKIYNGDIRKLPVECIVNAANEDLQHIGGVALAIANAAGPKLELDSKEYIKKHGRVKVGTCCVTSAGKLPYKYVIHTVGPIWGDYKPAEKDICFLDLKNAVEVTFRKAESLGLKSIAVPAISSGIFGVPKEGCAEQYAKAVADFSTSHLDTSLQEIHFVDIDRQMVHLIASTFEKHMGRKSYSKSKASSVRRTSFDDKATITKSPTSVETSSDNDDDCTVFDVTDKTSIFLKVGNVAEEDGAAVVCPQDKLCNSLGNIAGAISDRLGNMEQKMSRVRSVPKEGFANGKVIPTKTGKFTVPWEYILHAVCPRSGKDMSGERFEGDLKQTIRNVFQEAEKLGLTNLVCPLLGAGKSFSKFSKAKDIEKTCVNCLVDVLRDIKKGKCPLERIMIVVGSSSVLNTLKATLEAAGFCSRTKSKPEPECWEFPKKNRSKPSDKVYSKSQTYPPKPGIHSKCSESCKKPKTGGKCGGLSVCTPCSCRPSGSSDMWPSRDKKYEKSKGNQPFGTMSITKNTKQLPGYEESEGTLVIKYTFTDGVQTSSHPSPGKTYSGFSPTAYVPNTPKGRLVTKLLNVAFSRRLLFTVGPSPGISKEASITWNGVLHKTNITGGPKAYGYPDASYLDTVLEDLRNKNVSEESISHYEYNEFSRCFQK